MCRCVDVDVGAGGREEEVRLEMPQKNKNPTLRMWGITPLPCRYWGVGVYQSLDPTQEAPRPKASKTPFVHPRQKPSRLAKFGSPDFDSQILISSIALSLEKFRFDCTRPLTRCQNLTHVIGKLALLHILEVCAWNFLALLINSVALHVNFAALPKKFAALRLNF